MLPPVLPDEIATARLLLRRRRVDDAPAYREMWAERDPRVPPHRRIGPDGRPTVEDIAARIDAETHAPEVGLRTITRSRDGEVIGYCGLLFDGQSIPGEPELVYELLRRAQGHGFATEAAQAVVAWAADAGFARLWAGVRTWNLASRDVLRKLGFVETGRVVRDAAFGDSLITYTALVPTGQ
jgi:ribosomal-protein-alanine N-acetyltransferase